MKEESTIADDVEIKKDTIYAFPNDTDEYTIEFSVKNKEWYAYHHDEDMYDERVIIENSEVEFSDDILLFDLYNLTIEELNEMRELVQTDLELEVTNNL